MGTQFVVYGERKPSSATHNFINNEEVELTSGKWKKYKMNETCPLIKEWKVKHLKLYQNQVPTILQEIKEVRFSSLIELQIWGNMMESVQGFNKIDLQKLQSLRIADNYIINIAELKKVQWPNIIDINLDNNKINEVSALSFLPISYLVVHFGLSKEQCCNVRILAKVQLKGSSTLWSNSYNRVKQQKTASKALMRKYNLVHL